MNIYSLSIPLQVSAEHSARLKSLQETFALVCNALAPVVQETRCWNRVALHHMMYKTLREKFPQLGSQMVCNAIYSVSRTSRLVFQSAPSPFNIQLMADKPLPLLQFLPSAPVYFDRHTLSLKAGSLSMFTLDGRMRFELNMKDEDMNRFKTLKLHEIVLRSTKDQFTLSFTFGDGLPATRQGDELSQDAYLPEYVVLDQHPQANVLPTQPTAKIVNSKNTHTTPLQTPVNVQGVQLQLTQTLSSHQLHFTTAVPSAEKRAPLGSDASPILTQLLGATP